MAKPKLTYFDAPVSRGEECRLALHIAEVDFDDERLSQAQWQERKPLTPFGSIPTFELPGKPVLAQSTAILTYIGRTNHLHPSDLFEAARHEAMMQFAEDLRAQVSPTLRIKDAGEKKAAREALASGYVPTWGGLAEKQLGDGPFFAGSKLHVVDIKLFVVIRWFMSGALDHIPASVFAPFPKLVRLHDAVRDDPRVVAWYAKR